MIPSVFDIINAYSRKGRMNQNAMLTVLYGRECGVITAMKKPVDGYTEYIVDACMYADTLIEGWIKEGVTDDGIREGIQWAIDEAIAWHAHLGASRLEGADDAWTVARYIVLSADTLLMRSATPDVWFSTRCLTECHKLGLQQTDIEFVLNSVPATFPGKFISGMSDEEIHDAVLTMLKNTGREWFE